MKKNYVLLLAFLLLVIHSFSQTNPTVQNLPVSINFGSANFTPPAAAMVAWTGDGTRPYSTQAAAENSLPGADVAGTSLFGSAPTNGGAAGQYGHAVSANARLTILQSSNTTNGTTQTALAINTSGATSVTISYDLVLSIANTRDIGLSLQYRLGTAGSFTTIIGSNVIYNSTTSNSGDADGTSDFDNYSFSLPAPALNQPIVQLRWVTWRPAGTGNACGLGIDNISIATSLDPCTEPTNQPTSLILTPTPTTISGTFTAASPAVNEYLVVRSTVNTLSSGPVDGTFYTVGQALGGGTVVISTTSTSFTDINLTPSTTYYYYVFAHNNENCSNAPNYLQLNPLQNNSTTIPLPSCITPPLPPTNLILTPSNNVIIGSFTAATGANRYLSVISTSSTLSATPVDGTTYMPGQAFGGGTIINYTSATSISVLGLTVSTTYYIFIFSANAECTGEPFYNTASLNGSALTTNDPTGIPAGYYDAAIGLSCGPLKTAVRNIISANYVQLSYSPGVWDAFLTTDLHRNDANTADIIWDMYSDNPTGAEPYTYTFGTNQCGNYGAEGDCYNREHSFPKSWFNDAYPMYSDINHLFATDGYVNNKRGNQPYGEVSSPSWTSQNGGKLGSNTYPGFTGVVFEPRNEYKGDLARGQLYMVTRYENLVAGWQNNGNANDILNGTAYPALDDWYIKLMFKWHTNDPVSTKEINRNNAVFALQGNRNPFIDHPEYVYEVWQCTGLLPVTILDFTAQKNNESVFLKWYATHETNFKQYEIQRSTDGIVFSKIGELPGKNLANYSFIDNKLPAANTVYYRLKMIDIDGKFSYSKTIAIRISENFSNAQVYPNPTREDLTIRLQHALTENSKLVIADLSGRILLQQQVVGGQKNIDLDVSKFPAGRYFIKLSNSIELINQSFVIIK